MLNVLLKEPLGALVLGGFAERDDTVVLLVHVARDAADGAALAGRVTPFE